MAVTTKIVPKKAQKWPKMARFWQKWQYNGRVMAREVSFYESFATVGEIRVWWRADFQSGSRVLKKVF